MRISNASVALPIPTPDEVQEQLERIVASAEFTTSDRGRRFLRYIVEETLGGRSHYLKAYTIAQAVFDRGASFDAQNDPCVRMAASQIRRGLERYYLVAGGDDGVLITMPRGQYTPVFMAKPSGAEHDSGESALSSSDADLAPKPPVEKKPRGSRLTRWMMIGASIIVLGAVAMASLAERHNPAAEVTGTPTVLVERFVDNGHDRVSSNVFGALVDELVLDLSQSKNLVVIAPDDESKAKPTYVLQGSVRMQAEDMRWIARLVRNADGAVVWSGIYNIDTAGKNMLDVETTIARSISTAVVALRPVFRGNNPSAVDFH
jgi:TolB-like protein